MDDQIPRLGSAPKQPPKAKPPKSKGKKPGPKKLKTGPTLEGLDVFQTLLDSDAGGDSESTAGEELKEALKHKTRRQLSQIDRKLMRLSHQELPAGTGKRKTEGVYQRFSHLLAELLEVSVQEEARLQSHVAQRLDTLGAEVVDPGEAESPRYVKLAGRRITVRTFIRRYLGSELAEARQLLEDGKLLRQDARYGGYWFVMQALKSIVTS